MLKEIKISCPKCVENFIINKGEFHFESDLRYGKEKTVLHCVCKKCNVKLEIEV